VTIAGEKIYGQLDLPCDCGDEAMLERAAAKLPSQALWVTTPLTRTAQTQAALVSAATRLGVSRHASARIIEPRFMEQNLGQWQDCSRAEIDVQRKLPRPDYWLAGPHERPRGGESFLELAKRVVEGIDELQQSSGPEDIVAVAHAGTMRAALMHALELKPQAALRVAIANCAVVCIELIYDGPRRTGQLRL